MGLRNGSVGLNLRPLTCLHSSGTQIASSQWVAVSVGYEAATWLLGASPTSLYVSLRQQEIYAESVGKFSSHCVMFPNIIFTKSQRRNRLRLLTCFYVELFRLALNSKSSCLSLPSALVAGVCRHTQLKTRLSEETVRSW